MTDSKLHEDIGYIRRAVEDNCSDMGAITKEITQVKKDVAEIKTKITLITGWAAGAAAVVSLAFALIKDWWSELKT